MKKRTENIYWILGSIFIILSLTILFSFRIDMNGRTQVSGFITIQDYTVETLEDVDAPLGIRQRYHFEPDVCESSFCYLIFYTIHQEVIVFADETPIYSLSADINNPFGRTPGNIINVIQLQEEDLTKEIFIDFIPVYSSAIDSLPTIYYGDRYDIISSFFAHDLPSLIISIISILAGLFFSCFVLYAYKKGSSDSKLIMLGIFAILVGLWKLSDMTIFPYLIHNNPISTYLPFFTLLSACVPYVSFIRTLHTNKNHWAWNIPYITCCISMFLEIILQLLHIADFRETLFLTHISGFVLAFFVIVMMINEYCTYGFNKRLKTNLISLLICTIGLVIDLVLFYIGNGKGTLLCGMLGFVIYVFVLGIDSMQDIRKLIAIGQEAKKYEELAYHDNMTGFYNRTAYADYIGNENFQPEHMIVAMLDLNNLKKFNDEYGHDQGDIYITTCAHLITECFSDIGNCYRMGGDEFCILINGISPESCQCRVDKLYQKVQEENDKQNFPLQMQIACGFVPYDKELDYDIQDTVRRADKMMYQEKFTMKLTNGENMR